MISPRKIIESNLYINDFMRKTLFSQYNKKVSDFIKEVDEIDCIEDFDDFKVFMNNFKDIYTGGLFSIKRSFSESLLYGHVHSFADYADFSPGSFKYFPIIEHGIHFGMRVTKPCFPRAFQGAYLIPRYREVYGNHFPLYCLGPMLHYVKPYYDEKHTFDLKAKLKKTLLVVPFHTHELSVGKGDCNKFIDYVMNVEGKNYDTILVCAYWGDLENPIYRDFSSHGAKIVSAGFRGSPLFIKRLRTIIELADSVVSDAVGTYLGYCMYLGKPVTLIEDNIKIDEFEKSEPQVTDFSLEQTKEKFFKYFAPGVQAFSEKQMDLYNLYWGSNSIKTPEEIRSILSINEKIIKFAHGNISNICAATEKIYNSDSMSELERKVLSEAISI